MGNEVRSGLKGLKKKSDENQITINETDKTNKITVMDPSSYKESMEEHHQDVKVISRKELN